MSDKICTKCNMKGGIYRVDEAEIRGGSYTSCRYCGEVYEDGTPSSALEGWCPTAGTAIGSKGKYAKY